MTKNEILKTHKMTEQEFYKKFPTQEAYNQFQMGGSLSPKQKFQTGGIPPLPVDPSVMQNLTKTVPTFGNGAGGAVGASAGGAASGLGSAAGPAASAISAVPELIQGAKQPSGPEKGKTVGKTIGSTVGGIGGAIAGSILLPGVGTAIGGMLGSTLGGMAGGGIGKMVGNQNQEFKQETNQFKMGGNFTEYNGNKHENGGIPIGQSEVEGGETNNNGYIYSDTLKLGKKTFADMSKKINNKYSKRPDDKISMESKERELGNLAKMQESTGLTNNSRGMFQGGGKFNLNNPMSDDRATSLLMNELKFTPPEVVDDGQDYSAMFPKENKPFSKDIEDSILKGPSDGNSWGSSGTPPPSAPDTNKPVQTKVNPLGYLASAIGPAYDVARGLKGGDPVDFERVKPSFMYADPKSAITAMNNATSTSFNNARNAIRNNATSSGEYLAMMNNLAGSESLKRGLGEAQIKSEYDKMNTNTYNSIANQVKSQNAQIQMRESEARQQEQDAARSAVSQGLHNFGQNSLGYSQDVAMNKSQNMMTPFMADRFDLVEDAEGKISFKRKAIKKSDSKKDITPEPESKK